MVKRWKEVDEVIKATIEVPKELWQLEEQMREIPNFNKTDGAKKVYGIREKMEKSRGREPTAAEIAEELHVPVEELMMALEAGVPVESLQQMIYQGDGNEITLLDKLEENENQSEHVVDRLFLEELLGGLDGKERELIYQRYFMEKTQAE